MNCVACGDHDCDAVWLADAVVHADAERRGEADGVSVDECAGVTVALPHREDVGVVEGFADSVGMDGVTAALPDHVPVMDDDRVADAADAGSEPADGEKVADTEVVRVAKGAPPRAPVLTGVARTWKPLLGCSAQLSTVSPRSAHGNAHVTSCWPAHAPPETDGLVTQ